MKKQIKLNIASGVCLLGDDFINVDKYLNLEDLKKGAKTKKGQYANAVVPKGAKFIKGDLVNLPFPDNYADYILSVDTIEHVRMRDLPKAFAELYRVLKPGGRLTLVTTDFDDIALQWINLASRPFNFETYLELAQTIYGNQAGDEQGEIHKFPFNANSLNMFLQGVGFRNYTMDRHFAYTPYPEIEGYIKLAKGSLLKSSMFIIKATK